MDMNSYLSFRESQGAYKQPRWVLFFYNIIFPSHLFLQNKTKLTPYSKEKSRKRVIRRKPAWTQLIRSCFFQISFWWKNKHIPQFLRLNVFLKK